ncbi:MAG TPA: DUF58 domain-containing protein [Fulvivirga sp.]|nr:DUF58 domain-containing protein [Fulvivirga sp.]
MKTDYRQLLKPEVLNSIKGLELIAKVVVEGYLSGLNKSRKVGAGMEFSQYRSYEQGDDLRLLDWKMLARSGRYYIKQADIDTNIAVKFILDASNSMLHTEDGINKMDYARFISATLGYLSKHQGDAIGLFALNDHDLYSLFPKVNAQHFNRFLHQLVDIKNSGTWPVKSETTNVLHNKKHKELIVFITDMYQANNELTEFITRLKTKRNEVLLIHLMGRQELEMDYKGQVTFEDLESKHRVKVDVKSAEKAYRSALNEYMETVKKEMLQLGVDYSLFSLQDPIGDTLNLFLKRRSMLL